MDKERLDRLLVRRGLAETRSQAQRFIMAGEVRVAGQISDKPGCKVPADAHIELEERPRFVSRGGEKLDAALIRFDLDVRGWVVADVGASTGGFTDCLLQHGAIRVYAIDVGYGQLDWQLRNDQRVTVMERTNARYLERLPEPVDLVTVDVSFISLGLILPPAVDWLRPGGEVVALIKPQFEAGPRDVEKGGVVRDPEVHRAVLGRTLEMAVDLDLGLCGLIPSPLRGPAGNVEFLGWWKLGEEGLERESAITSSLDEVEGKG
ncbi:MAG: TlyA family RNA methyltransferase [Anaerolineae bacterium]